MKISIKDYAELKKISTQAVYQAVAKNKIETVTENGIKYIIIPERIDTELDHEKTTKIESADFLNKKIKNLEDMLKKEVEARERAENDKESLNKNFEEQLNKEKLEREKLEQQQKEAIEKAEQREKEAIARAEADKKELYKQIEMSNLLQLKALETVKQLEHKTEVIEDELIKEKSKTIWQRIFKK
jgi:stage V sporulation protein SpoVS